MFTVPADVVVDCGNWNDGFSWVVPVALLVVVAVELLGRRGAPNPFAMNCALPRESWLLAVVEIVAVWICDWEVVSKVDVEAGRENETDFKAPLWFDASCPLDTVAPPC